MAEFANLSAAQRERLEMLAEEAAEIVQAVTKILRHGYESYDPTAPEKGNNADMLRKELDELRTIEHIMVHENDISPVTHVTGRLWSIWIGKLPWTHHQEGSPK